jgi:hypothetical protein
VLFAAFVQLLLTNLAERRQYAGDNPDHSNSGWPKMKNGKSPPQALAVFQ